MDDDLILLKIEMQFLRWSHVHVNALVGNVMDKRIIVGIRLSDRIIYG